jgi:hypothetical protein
MMQKQGLPTVFRKGNDRVSENDREEKKEKRQRQHCDTEAVFGSFSEKKTQKGARFDKLWVSPVHNHDHAR